MQRHGAIRFAEVEGASCLGCGDVRAVLAHELDRAERLDQALDAWYQRRRPRAGLVQSYSTALMRQEQGEPTEDDLRLLELPLPAVQARLAQPY
jgi:2-polyprenyl-6-methoxyphenol hydroxylase-like FAD-dependent oxidoreductase